MLQSIESIARRWRAFTKHRIGFTSKVSLGVMRLFFVSGLDFGLLDLPCRDFDAHVHLLNTLYLCCSQRGLGVPLDLQPVQAHCAHMPTRVREWLRCPWRVVQVAAEYGHRAAQVVAWHEAYSLELVPLIFS
jgi:hypothetical protein